MHDTCKAPDCENTKLRAKGYCSKHYQQVRKYGKIMPHKENGYWGGKACRAPGCQHSNLVARGYCLKHYKYVRKYGRPWKDENDKTCQVSSCKEERVAFGYCLKHYNQYKKYGRIKRTHGFPKTCTVFGCEEKAWARGFCNSHYRAKRRLVTSGKHSWREVYRSVIESNTQDIMALPDDIEREKKLEEMVNLEIITEIMADEPETDKEQL